MTRRIVAEGDLYRVVLVKKKMIHNPDYVQGNRETPYWLYLDETFEEQYGPYNTVGTCKAILTRESLDYNKQPRPEFVCGRVEKADITWRVVNQ